MKTDATYFTPMNATGRFFFVRGMTADEFYTDGGLMLDIEQLTFLELRRSGYKRIVFYDKDFKFYCYDDESYALMKTSGQSIAGSVQSHGNREQKNTGLKTGKRGRKKAGTADSTTQNQPKTSSGETAEWIPGEKSGVRVRNIVSSQLHLGMADNTVVKRQIDAYIEDSKIKTAVVINDAESFLREFKDDPSHSFTARYERQKSYNENIVVLLYPDMDFKNLYKKESQKDTVEGNDDTTENAEGNNEISITCPNAIEIKNMLLYYHFHYGLRLRMNELDRTALALRQAMSFLVKSEKGEKKEAIHIKRVAPNLRTFGSETLFTAEDCYKILEVKKPKSAHDQFSELIGMQSVKAALEKFQDDSRDPIHELKYYTASRMRPDQERPKPKEEMIHFVLTGNPGTGKTTAAKLLGQLFFEMGYLESGHVVETDRSDLVAGYVGQTAIRTRKCVEAALGGVLFIDEAYTLKRRQDTGNDFGQEAIDTLVKLMDQYKGRFIVVAAGYKQQMEPFLTSNPGFSRRFPEPLRLHIEDYTPEEMQEILKFHARKNHARFSDELQKLLPDFCINWVNLADENWGNAGEAFNLVNDAVRNWRNDPNRVFESHEEGEDWCILEKRHFPDHLQKNFKPVADLRQEVLNHLNGMTGLAGVKVQIQKLYNRMLTKDMTAPGHYLFVGNPGTGKTTIARYMGQLLRNLGLLKRGHLVEYTATSLISDVYNEQNHGDFQCVGRKALNGVLFIDEAYQLESDPEGRGKAVLDALLPFMEKYRDSLCVICAGYEDEMKKLVDTNPGFPDRFRHTIRFENYSVEELLEILLKMLKAEGIETTEGYRENARRALTGYLNTYGGNRDFGNARFLRENFIIGSKDARNYRLVNKYGENIPQEEIKKLLDEDIPEEMLPFIRTPLPKENESNRTAMDKISVKDKDPENVPSSTEVLSYETQISVSKLVTPIKNFQFHNQVSQQIQGVTFIATKLSEGICAGTGFLITLDGYILTCNHVVPEQEGIRVRLNLQDGKTVWKPANLVLADPELDIALLKIPDGNYPALPLCSELKGPAFAQSIYLLGYPFGLNLNGDLNRLQTSVFRGSVSSIQTLEDIDRIMVDMGGKAGCSGAPVLSEKDGTVIGIFCGSLTNPDSHEEINFALPIKYIWKRIIRRNECV